MKTRSILHQCLATGCMLLLLAGPARPTDFYAITQTVPELDVLPPYRDIRLPASDFTERHSQHTEDYAVFTPDARALFFQAHKKGTGAQGGGTLAHIYKFDLASGKTVLDIPLDPRFPGNPLTKLLAPLKAEEAELLAVHGNTLAAAVLVGYQPKRWVLVLFDAKSGKPVKALKLITTCEKSVASTLQFSPDGQRLLFENSGVCPGQYIYEIPSGQAWPPLKLEESIKETEGVTYAGGLFPLSDNQAAFYGYESEDRDAQPHVYLFDLQARSILRKLTENLEVGLNPDQHSRISTDGTMITMAARDQGDNSNENRCAGGDPCLRLYKFPEMELISQYRVKNENGQILTEWVGSHRAGSPHRFGFSPYDPRLLMTGEHATAKNEYAMLFDNSSGEIVGWYDLPLHKGNTTMEIGTPPEGGFLIMGLHPSDDHILRILKIPPAGE